MTVSLYDRGRSFVSSDPKFLYSYSVQTNNQSSAEKYRQQLPDSCSEDKLALVHTLIAQCHTHCKNMAERKNCWHIEELTWLIGKQYIDLNERDKENQTPLMIAVIKLNGCITSSLLNLGASITCHDSQSKSAADHAFSSTFCREFFNLSWRLVSSETFPSNILWQLEPGETIRQVDSLFPNPSSLTNGEPILHLAFSQGLKCFQVLFQHYFDKEKKEQAKRMYGIGPFQYQELINGIKRNILDTRNSCGETVLHVACILKNKNQIKFLVQNNADILSVNSHGTTPLAIAIESDRSDILELFPKKPVAEELLKIKERKEREQLQVENDKAFPKNYLVYLENPHNGSPDDWLKAMPSTKLEKQMTAAHTLVNLCVSGNCFEKNQEDCWHFKHLKALTKQGLISIDENDDLGQTPLMIAVKNRQQVVVEKLISCGAQLGAIDNRGDCAKDYAITYDFSDQNLVSLNNLPPPPRRLRKRRDEANPGPSDFLDSRNVSQTGDSADTHSPSVAALSPSLPETAPDNKASSSTAIQSVPSNSSRAVLDDQSLIKITEISSQLQAVEDLSKSLHLIDEVKTMIGTQPPKLRKFEHSESLLRFARQLHICLENIFIGFKAVSSGQVMGKKSNLSRICDPIVSIVGLGVEQIPMFGKAVRAIIEKGIYAPIVKVADERKKNETRHVATLALLSEYTKWAGSIAFHLTERYEEQIESLATKEDKIQIQWQATTLLEKGKQSLLKEQSLLPVDQLVAFLVPWIVAKLLTIEYAGKSSDKPLDQYILDEMSEVAPSEGIKQTWNEFCSLLGVSGLLLKTGQRREIHQFFWKPGIRTKEGKYFAPKDGDQEQFGWRLGSKEQAILLNMFEVSPPTVKEVEQSKKTPTETSAPKASSQTQEERLELLERIVKELTASQPKQAGSNLKVHIGRQAHLQQSLLDLIDSNPTRAAEMFTDALQTISQLSQSHSEIVMRLNCIEEELRMSSSNKTDEDNEEQRSKLLSSNSSNKVSLV